MEKRVTKVSICSAGGTAAKGSKTCKVALPTTWMNQMGIDGKLRDIEITFDGAQIVLSRRYSGEEFVARKLEQGHDVRLVRFFDGDKLCSVIYADFTDRTLLAENHVSNPVKTAFGNNVLPTWEDLLSFLEDRCIPRERAGVREYLEVIGVCEYDPIEIINKTSGRMAEDNQSLSIQSLLW